MEGLSQLQDVINKVVKDNYAMKYGLPKDSFYITLAPKMFIERGEGVRIERGYPTAMIYIGYLPIPSQEKQFKDAIFDALSAIKKLKLYNCTEIVAVSYIKKIKTERKKWLSEKGMFDSDLIPDLIPKYRLRVSTITSITMTDTLTGQSVTVNSNMEKEWKSSKSLYDEARSRLSAIVIPATEEDEDGSNEIQSG